MTAPTSLSNPGTPWASTRSFRNVSLRSMIAPGWGSGLGRGAHAPAARLVEREVQHALHDLLVGQAAGLGGHRHEAGRRHAGDGVDFETIGDQVLAEAEVEARDAAADRKSTA